MKRKLNCEDCQHGFSLLELFTVIFVILILTTVAIPLLRSMMNSQRISGDARDINEEVAVTKMRAAADFTQARLYADLNAQTFRIDRWNKTGAGSWVTEGGTQSLAQGVTFGFGALGTPPTGTQATIGQAPACLDNGGKSIANTACIVFNSRAVPVDATGKPTPNDAIYLTDGNLVYGVTVSATSLIQTWRSPASKVGWLKL